MAFLAQPAVSNTGTGASVTVTLGSPTTPGNCLIVCVVTSGASGNPTISGITLGGSADHFAASISPVGNPSTADETTFMWSDQNCAGSQTSVSVSVSASGASVNVTAMEWAGIFGSGAVDQAPAGQNNDTGVSSWSSGATGTTTQPNEVVIGVVGAFNASGIGTITGPGGPWTNVTQETSASTHVGLLVGWQVVTATGAFTYSGTFAGASNYAAGIATFKANPSVQPPPPPFLVAPGWQSPSSLTRLAPPVPSPPAAVVPAAAGLDGHGDLGATGLTVLPGAAGMDGHGDLSATGSVTGAQLTGRGDLGAFESVQYSALTGRGDLASFQSEQYAGLAGQGDLGITGEHLGFVAGLTGLGFLSIPQVSGGLVAGVGGAGTPLALPGSSQVAVAPPGSSAWQWVGTLGQVTALTYSFVCPGGCDKLSMTVMVPASYRTQLFNPGWQVKVTRGGHDVWHGKLDEPVPTPQGWTLTAVGSGNRAQDFVAYYTAAWGSAVADDIVNKAIARGLPWLNPGLSSNANASQFWLGQQFDPGSQNVGAFLNLLCTRGALTWYVNSQPGGLYGGDDLNIFPLPTAVSRLLVVSTPVARTLGGDINTIYIKYEVTADNTTTNASATYATTSVQNAQSVTAHQEIETYIDLSNVGVQTATAAQATGNYVLQIYQRASFAGPFTAAYGQLLTTGGQPVDPGTDQAGSLVQLVLTDYGYGGEVTPQFPVTFITGAYEWDDFAQVATITPYQSVDQSLTGLLSLENTVLTPIAAAG